MKFWGSFAFAAVVAVPLAVASRLGTDYVWVRQVVMGIYVYLFFGYLLDIFKFHTPTKTAGGAFLAAATWPRRLLKGK